MSLVVLQKSTLKKSFLLSQNYKSYSEHRMMISARAGRRLVTLRTRAVWSSSRLSLHCNVYIPLHRISSQLEITDKHGPGTSNTACCEPQWRETIQLFEYSASCRSQVPRRHWCWSDGMLCKRDVDLGILTCEGSRHRSGCCTKSSGSSQAH